MFWKTSQRYEQNPGEGGGGGGGGALASPGSKTMKTAEIFSGHYSYLRRVAKPPVFRVTAHVHNKPDCTGKEVEGLYYL